MTVNRHHRPNAGRSDRHLTPPWLLQALGAPEAFDLDPCGEPSATRPWACARETWSLEEHHDGCRPQDWDGTVFCNPPYASVGRWAAAMAQHDDGVLLVFARTDVAWWHRHVWPRAAGILFLRGRPRFCLPDGTEHPANCGGPIAAAAYGLRALELLCASNLDGALVEQVTAVERSTGQLQLWGAT